MADWSGGYVKGIDYTHSYHFELNPVRAQLALIKAGFAPHAPVTGVACELGFGFGVSANIHAAASTTEWWGNDFNPTQARFARELADVSGAKAHFFDESFAEFCQRSDLPEFDFICLHGIWTWVSDENRQLIIDFIRRRLRVGGMVYISYNTQPGWSQIVPLRQLMMEHADSMTASGLGIAARIDAAVAFAEQLIETSSGYAALNPAAVNCLKSLHGASKNYLAHEFFNRDWQPMMFAEFARWMEPAKLSFACSAGYFSDFDIFNLVPAQREFLNKIPDTSFQQSTRDFIINRQFRKDYWIKGPSRLDTGEQQKALRAQRVVLLTEPDAITLRAGGALAERDLPEAVYRPLIDALSDREPHSLGELEDRLKTQNIQLSTLVESVMVLAGKGDLASAQDEHVVAAAAATSARLNRHLIASAASAGPVLTLASPLTGGGMPTDSTQLLFLLARMQGAKDPRQWAEFIWQIYLAKNARVVKDGRMLATAEENLAALNEEANSFATGRLSLLQALKVVD